MAEQELVAEPAPVKGPELASRVATPGVGVRTVALRTASVSERATTDISSHVGRVDGGVRLFERQEPGHQRVLKHPNLSSGVTQHLVSLFLGIRFDLQTRLS